MPTIPFTRTAAQVGTIDSTAYDVLVAATNAGLARVPKSLVLYKPAGTAYTCAAGSRLVLKDDDGNVLFSLACEGFLDQATAQSRYLSPVGGLALSANSTTFSLSCTGSVADAVGSPDLNGRFSYEEAQIVW